MAVLNLGILISESQKTTANRWTYSTFRPSRYHGNTQTQYADLV